MIATVYGHLGYELHPAGFSRHWLGKWITSGARQSAPPTFGGQLRLILHVWDRMMGNDTGRLRPTLEEVTTNENNETDYWYYRWLMRIAAGATASAM